VIMTMPILEGLDGVQKMSKSLGNYVGIDEPPAEMFGKLMSISDEMMWRYHLLLTDMTPAQIEDLKASVASGKDHPLEVKKALARRIVTDFHSADAATQAQQDFEAKYGHRGIDPNAPRGDAGMTQGGDVWVKVGPCERVIQWGARLDSWLVTLDMCKSKSEAQRQIKAGAVYIAMGDLAQPAWTRITDPAWEFLPVDDSRNQKHSEVAFKVGRKQRIVEFRPKSSPSVL